MNVICKSFDELTKRCCNTQMYPEGGRRTLTNSQGKRLICINPQQTGTLSRSPPSILVTITRLKFKLHQNIHNIMS